jgi:putative transposase
MSRAGSQKMSERFNSYRKSSNCVYAIEYHIAFVTRSRRRILDEVIKKRVEMEIREACRVNKIIVKAGRVASDHIQLELSAPPSISVADMVKVIKGRTSRKVQEEFGHRLKELSVGSIWAKGYIVSNTEDAKHYIKQYIENHDGKEREYKEFGEAANVH